MPPAPTFTLYFFIIIIFFKSTNKSVKPFVDIAVCLYQGSKGAGASHSTYYPLPERNPFNPTFLLDFNMPLKTFTPLLGLSSFLGSWRMSGFFLYVFFCLSCVSLACLSLFTMSERIMCFPRMIRTLSWQFSLTSLTYYQSVCVREKMVWFVTPNFRQGKKFTFVI